MGKLHLQASAGVVTDYFRLFVNRRAYTLQSNRPHPDSGRHYYYRPTDKTTGQGLSLAPDTIRRHLEGEITIGLYAINPATQSCKWVAIDADHRDAVSDLLRLGSHLKQDGVASALEKSSRGGHLWIFMAEPLLARDCRIYVSELALRLGIPVKAGRQREGIEIFPKQDRLRSGRYGNAIRGPLGIHRGAGQRFWFCGAEENLEAQMHYLKLIPKVTDQQLLKNGYPQPSGLRTRHMNSMLRRYNWGFPQTYLLGRFVEFGQRCQEIRFRLRIERSLALWAYTLSRSVCCAFARRVVDAAAWFRDPAAPGALFRRNSAGDCPGATKNPSDFAKVPTFVSCRTLEI